MKLRINEITDEVQEVRLELAPDALTEGVRDTERLEFQPSAALTGRLEVYRAGEDLIVGGEVHAEFTGPCSRCLTPVPAAVRKSFHTVLLPETEDAEAAPELSAEDLSLGFFSGEELDLAPIALEQVLLELPTRALCAADCRGLCSSCGSNLNDETCSCSTEVRDPRLAVLHNLKVDRH